MADSFFASVRVTFCLFDGDSWECVTLSLFRKVLIDRSLVLGSVDRPSLHVSFSAFGAAVLVLVLFVLHQVSLFARKVKPQS